MRKTASATMLALAALSLSSTALADWTWKKADNPSTANSGGLMVGGKIACKGTVNGKVLLGTLRNGLCDVRESASSTKTLSAPNYEFLAAGANSHPLAMLNVPGLAGPPRGALREKLGEQGLLLCKANGELGWVDATATSRACMTPGGRALAFVVMIEHSDDGFSDLPPLWRDLTTSGSISNSLPFCRASLTPGAIKMAPGIYNAGKCTYLTGFSFGQPIFASTTDKSRYLLLFRSSNSWEKLEKLVVKTEAALRIGQLGNSTILGCWAHGTTTNGLLLQNACFVPPSSGTGAGQRMSTVLDYLTVLGRFSTSE